MVRIRKYDKVLLPDGATGETLEAFVTKRSETYKIRRLDNNEIEYYDGERVRLKAKDLRNMLSDLLHLN